MKKVDKGGRPKTVLTEKQIAELKTLSAVLNKEQLADYFGVSHVTLIAIEKRQPEVSLAYKKGKAKCFILKLRQVGKKRHVSKQLKAARLVIGIL